MSNDQLISVVSPVYGCKDCLIQLVASVSNALEHTPYDWELVLVDDRGPDEPWDIIAELSQKHLRVRGIRLARNHGQHLAIWAGLKASQGDWVVVVDCDLQDNPSYIPQLMEKAISEKVEAVIVERGSWSDSTFRRVSSRSFYRIVKVLSGINLSNVGNFGIYSRRMVDLLLRFEEQDVYLPLMVSITGLKKTQLVIDREERHSGQSSYTIRQLFRLAFSLIVNFSDRPLKYVAALGAVMSFVSVIFSITLIGAHFFGAFTVPGWTSIILSMWFLSGLILAVLGIHGIYLGRIFSEAKRRPRIIVEDETDTIKRSS